MAAAQSGDKACKELDHDNVGLQTPAIIPLKPSKYLSGDELDERAPTRIAVTPLGNVADEIIGSSKKVLFQVNTILPSISDRLNVALLSARATIVCKC